MTDQNNALTKLSDAAVLVEKYATRLVGSDEAKQFSTHISVMAQKDERFKNANPESVVASMMACVSLQLMPNTPQQYAYLIPYQRNGRYDIQFQLGYKGLIELANRTGQIKALYAELVFDGDIFNVELGTERRLVHEPDMAIDRTDYTKVTAAYMVAVLTNGEKMFEVMNRDQLDKIQKSSKAKSTDTPWQTWPTEMARKTVVKRGLKLLPSSGDDSRLAFATALDSWSEAGKLKFTNEQLVEGEEVDPVDAKTERIERIKAAEAKHEELNKKDFTPKAVEVEVDNG